MTSGVSILDKKSKSVKFEKKILKKNNKKKELGTFKVFYTNWKKRKETSKEKKI